MKKLISTLTAIALTAAMVTGCASNSEKSEMPEGVQKVPVSQIWDGYEDMQGKDFGVIKMPDKIEKQDVKGYYALEMTPTDCDEATASVKFFKAFFGDKYNESMISIESNTGDHSYNDPDVGFATFLHASENHYAMPVNALLTEKEIVDNSYEAIGIYYPDKDRNVRLDPIGGSCTVGEIADTVSRFMKEGLYPLYDSDELTIKPYKVLYFRDRNNKNKKMAYVVCAYDYKGIYLQDNYSALADTTILAGHEVQVYYSFFHLVFDLMGKDQITSFAGRTLPFDPHAEELTELVPLSNAVELLQKELAVNSRYEFDKVELKYCQKVIAPSNFGVDPEYDAKVTDDIDKARDPIDKKIVPTWCFEWTGYDINGAQDCAIKVNAVTGEITVDAKPTADKPLDGSDPSFDEPSSSEPDDSSQAEFPIPEGVAFDIISYDGKTLVYEYNGKTDTIDLEEPIMQGKGTWTHRLINNKFGIKLKGIFKYDAWSKFMRLDVITLNGEFKGGYFDRENDHFEELTNEQLEFIYSAVPDGVPMDAVERFPEHFDSLAIAKRIKGSLYEVTSIYGTEQIDLNDLGYYQKANYPDEIKGVSFSIFYFNSGEHFLYELLMLRDAEIVEDSQRNESPGASFSSMSITDLPMFAGKIQSMTEDRAVVLLNDGKTTCDVPTYYNDGELKEGMDVMLTLEAEPTELYGSGQEYKAEYAVFTIHPDILFDNYTQADIPKIAYGYEDHEEGRKFNATMADDIKQDK